MKKLLTISNLLLLICLSGCSLIQKEEPDVITQIDENTWTNQDGRYTNEEGEILSTSENIPESNQGL